MGPVSPDGPGWRINRMKAVDTKSTCGRFPREAGRSLSPVPAASIRDGLVTAKSYFIAPDAKMMAVSIRTTATTLNTGVPAALFQTRRLGGGSNVIGRSHQYDVAADGRFLINVDVELSATPITLLLNWKP